MAKLDKFLDKHLPKAVLTAVGLAAFNIGGKTFELIDGIDPDLAFQEILKSSTSTVQLIILTIIYVFLKSQRMNKK